MAYSEIIHEQRDDIVLLTLNRPDKLNTWTPTMSAELTEAIEAADADSSVGAAVVMGAGRGFCAGADISAVFGAQLITQNACETDPSAAQRRELVRLQDAYAQRGGGGLHREAPTGLPVTVHAKRRRGARARRREG